MERFAPYIRAFVLGFSFIMMAFSGSCQCGGKITEPAFDNPLDPESDNYTPPRIEVVSSVGDGDTAYTSSLEFRFAEAENITAYRYRLVYQQQDFTDWSGTGSVSYDYLDEGANDLYVEVQTTTGGTVRDTISFFVDAVQGPALMLRPRYTEVDVNQDFTLDVVAEDVTGLMMAEIALGFQAASFRCEGVDTGAFFAQSGMVPVLLDTISSGAVTVNAGMVSGTGDGCDGSGVVARVTFKALSATGATPGMITFGGADSCGFYTTAWDSAAGTNLLPFAAGPLPARIIVK